MDAFGLEVLLLETVGVGQAEYDVMDACDTVIVYDGTYTDGSGNLVESYDAASSYIGYFDATAWYAYDLAAGNFVVTWTTAGTEVCSAAGP